MIYLLNLLIVPIYYIFFLFLVGSKTKARKPFFIVFTLHAVLFRALSNPFNYVDTVSYVNGFGAISQMTFKEAVLSINFYSVWGQLFVALNWLISQITSDYIGLHITVSVISVCGVLWYYYKTTYTPLITVLFFLIHPMIYIMGFGVIRQYLAVAFVVWAIYYIYDLKISIPLTILGVLCHTGTIVIIPFFFLRNINLYRINGFRVLFILIIIVLGFRFALNGILSYLPRYEFFYEGSDDSLNIIPFILIGSLLLVSYILKLPKRILSNQHDCDLLNFMIYGLALSIFCIGLPGGGRLSSFHIWMFPVAMSLLFKYSTPKNLFIVKIYMILVFMLGIRQVYISSQIDSSPYHYYDYFWENSSNHNLEVKRL